MPLVPALCPQCGATLEVNPDSEAAVCKFCNTPFITEKAVTNYNVSYNTTNVSNNTTVNNISNSEVHIHQNSEDAQTMLEKIKGLCARGKSNTAYNTVLQEMVKNFPTDYRTDEAATVCALGYGIPNISDSSYDSELFNLVCGMQALSASNYETAKKYSEQIQKETNEYINSKFGVNLSGGLYFYKLGIGTLPRQFENLTKYVDEYYPMYVGKINNYCANEYQLNLVYEFAKQVNDNYIIHISNIISFLETGKACVDSKKISSDYKLHGTDDEFCEYVAGFANIQADKLQKRLEHANEIIRRYNANSATFIKTDIFDRIVNAAIRLMSPEYAERYKAKAKLLAEQKAQEEHERKIARMTARYNELLAAGKTKDAFAFLEQNDFLADKNAEMKKFRKTLFGYKYRE